MFSRPVRIGVNPAPSEMSDPTRPLSSMRPRSGLMSPFSIFNSVVFPAPFRPMRPRHSPRASSSDTPSTAQNSSGRRPLELFRPTRSAAVSFNPYHSERFRSRQYFFDTPSIRTSTSALMSSIAETNNEMRQGQAIHDPSEH